MSQNIAIIDIGTNTFNLLIVTVDTNQFKTLHVGKIAARLGKGGINSGKIADDAFTRGIDAIIEHKNTAEKFNCTRIIAIATSMLRDSENSALFCNSVKEKTGISISIVSGDEEAELIWNGVRHAIDLSGKKLIMDIGGGSTEFIIADHEKMYWKKSYDLGVTRLYEKFNHSDPIQPDEKKEIQNYLNEELTELYQQSQLHKITHLIGSAGTFESYATIISLQKNDSIPDFSITAHEILLPDFNNLANWFYLSNHDERKELQGLIELRRNLIVISTILIDAVLTSCSIQKMDLSTYALKEGVVYKNLI